MTQLITKGGFRERANRSRKYKQSENEVTTLTPTQYKKTAEIQNLSENLEQSTDTDTDTSKQK